MASLITFTPVQTYAESALVPNQFYGMPIVQASVVLEKNETIDLRARAKEIADEYGVSFEIMDRIIEQESQWNPTAISETGDYGLSQINLKYHPDITEAQALDPEFALRFLAQTIKAGDEWKYTECNCVSTVKLKISNLPKMAEIIPNAQSPKVGGIVIFQYGKNKHIAYIEKISYTDKDNFMHLYEGNMEKCKIGRRVISFNDKNITGFFNMPLVE